jgi:molecular chaperone DnaK (HSP70)
MIRTVGIDIGTQKTIIVADDGEIVRTSTGSVSFPTLIAFQDKTPRNIGDEAASGDTIISMVNLIAGKSVEEIQACEALSLSKISFTASDYATSPNVLVKSGSDEENLNVSSLLGCYICKIWERICQVYGDSANLAIACPNFSPTVRIPNTDTDISAGQTD